MSVVETGLQHRDGAGLPSSQLGQYLPAAEAGLWRRTRLG
jgi:hypothetical protein